MICRPDGPEAARIMLVGEAPGESEEQAGVPFVGVSGQELNRMLGEAGIMRSECFTTNVCRVRPKNNDIGEFIALKKKDITPAHKPLRDKMVLPPIIEGYELLLKEISLVNPTVIVAFGNLALWALTGAWGVTKWRGSILGINGDQSGNHPLIISTYHPAAVLRQWEWRAACVSDLRRAKRCLDGLIRRPPEWSFIVRPSFAQTVEVLHALLGKLAVSELWIDFDLETRSGHIACAGLSWSLSDAICIPFMQSGRSDGYWSEAEESAIVHLLYQVLTHERVKVRWQNGLYDAQYTYRHWHFIPRGAQDTMISQHTMFCILPKSLAFQASMYCDYYIYWKDDGKTWVKEMDETHLWRYNCIDCVRTREVGEVELATIPKMSLSEVEAFQQKLFWPVLRAMNRGLRVDLKARNQLAMELMEEIGKREQYLVAVFGHPVNPKSPKQMATLFYEDLGQKAIMSRAKKGVPAHVTCDDEALNTIANREPLLRPIVNAIADIRTLGVLLSTFVNAKLDIDGRMRCSFNIAGNTEGKGAPATYRLSSSENAFDSGANLQNIPSEKSKSMGKMSKRGSAAFELPNIRRLYIPDPGFTFFDMDLDRADLQVVVWESEDEVLKEALRLGADIHLLNVFVLDGEEAPDLSELVEGHPKYLDHRGPRKHKREFAKVFCHATNYGGGAKTVAGHTGRTVHEVERAQRTWFGAHPGIKSWHSRTEQEVFKRRYVENKFGYRWYIFDRPEGLLPEALAWVPQSTVACVINRAWLNIHEQLPEVEVLLQVHDSLAGQIPTHKLNELLPKIKEAAKIPIPYPDQLVIPVGLKISDKSWGDCGT